MRRFFLQFYLDVLRLNKTIFVLDFSVYPWYNVLTENERGIPLMKINDRKLYDVQFSHEELEALQGAERAITEIVTLFGSEGHLMSAETGEVVMLDELNRVRGILDFFYDHRVFERI
jgi:hypothetical protein